METIIATSVKRILYNDNEYTLLKAGKHLDDTPYVELQPECAELNSRICDEIQKTGSISVWAWPGPMKLILGEDRYPCFR